MSLTKACAFMRVGICEQNDDAVPCSDVRTEADGDEEDAFGPQSVSQGIL